MASLFDSSGKTMFIVRITGDDVNVYKLTLAYDVPTASHKQNFYSVAFLANSAPFTIDLILSKETSLVLVRRPQSGLT